MMNILFNFIKYHKIKLIILLSVIFICGITQAQNPPNELAKKFATDFFNARNLSKHKSASNLASITQSYQSEQDVKTPLFVFQLANNGFVMLAQNENSFRVVGYSEEESFQSDNIPPQLQALMTYYEDSLEFTDSTPTEVFASTTVVAPLLYDYGIKLNQYNHPEVGGSFTGCMATAFAQIMLYNSKEFNKPIKGYGSHCYNYGSYGEICADFENANYSNDPELLSYHVAIAMDMRFTTAGSSPPPTIDIIGNFDNYFHYFIVNGTSENFYLKNELEHRRPVYATIIGFPDNHAVVIDGYDNRDYYHLNFGWGGYFNGYFLMNDGSWFGTGNGAQRFATNFSTIYLMSNTPKPVNKQDSLTLVSMHNSLGGYDATNWDLTKPVWTWPGVLVMNDRVIRLTINSSIAPVNAQSITPEIGNLTALQELSLYGCFNGNIPSSITNLKDLKELNITNTAIYISPNLHKGNLKAQLPADIGKLTQLEWLSISNVLEGNIPASIGNLSNLKLLRIHQDTSYFGKGSLSGQIPSQIGNLSKLQQLHISNQSLSGNLPASIENLTELTELDFSGNQLSGKVSALNFPKVLSIKLNDNSFTEISDEGGNCPNLMYLELQNNKITGSIPNYFGSFTALKSLNLSDNEITSLPEEIGNLIQLESFKIDNNQLESLPDGLALILKLKYFSASHNLINYIPSNFGQANSLVTLDLSFNQIPSIPYEIGNNPDLYEILLNNNKITSIPESFANIENYAIINLRDNEIEGAIPENIMMDHIHGLQLNNNRFVFKDIPKSDQLKFGVRNQKAVSLKNQIYKVQIGDTVTIDIRSISNLTHPDNEYYWLIYPELIPVNTKDNRFDSFENNPVLKVVIDENTINNKYYCKIFNSQSPSFSTVYQNSTYVFPCMDYLNSDTVVFKLSTDEEIIAEKYSEEFVTSLKNISDKTISDGTVTLVPPLKIKRGEIYWEASADGETWERVSETMERLDLKANIKSFGSDELELVPKNTAYYRCCIDETDCDPIYSEKLKVEALGTVLFDEIINVTENTRTISVDSIEVIVPKDFHDADFRMTITKIGNPPADTGMVISGSAYDVTASFADEFSMPLLIKLKNIDKSKITDKSIDQFKAVYYDDLNRVWQPFEHASLSLKDSSINIVTNHLTKIKWWWYTEEYRSGFTDVYERNNILVFYKENDEMYMNFGYDKKQSAQPWHVSDIPLMVQDITEYLPKVMAKYKSLGLTVPDGKFKVYVKYLEGEDGEVGILGMLQGYLCIGRDLSNPTELKQSLAHEFMHYTQDNYIAMANGGNLFWLEAHATLSDRIVWDSREIPLSESEEFFRDGRQGKVNYTFNLLSDSWDAWDVSMVTNKFFGNVQYYYTAGTFLHYMRSYREDSKKLNPATLLKETSWFGSWRKYLGSYVSSHLNSILGDEYEDYVKYVLSGKNENFTLLNKKGNPYAFIQDPKNKNVFTYPISYRFKEGDEMVQKDEMEITVPYLAAKIVLLENQNPDTLVMVNYKRKHDFDFDHLVYYATYDAKKQEMIFVDISDSTEYNFLLDTRNEENRLKKFGNISFLLLINKEYIGVSSLIKDFNASFDLTAMPVLNIESVGMLDIYNGSSPMKHSFDNKTDYISIGSPNADFLQKVTGFNVSRIENNSTKRIINDRTYQIQTQFSLVIDQGQTKGMPTMKDSTVYTQTIEHDVISGILKITEHEQKIHKLNTYIEFTAGPGGDVVEKLVYSAYTDNMDEKIKTYWLKDVMGYIQPETSSLEFQDSYGKNIVMFKTNNTAETQNVVSKIDAMYKTTNYSKNGEVVSTSESTYSNTDFSNPNLNLFFIIRTKQD